MVKSNNYIANEIEGYWRSRRNNLYDEWTRFIVDLVDQSVGAKFFVTLTYKKGIGEEPTFSEAKRKMDLFELWCKQRVVHGVAVLEQGKLFGRIHHHVLLTDDQSNFIKGSMSDNMKKVLANWKENYGFVGVSLSKNGEAVSRYCAKYLVKTGNISDWRYF